MSERITEIAYTAPTDPSTKESLETTLFLTGPAEFLCAEIATKLLSITAWSTIFGEYIDPYKRMDYSFRALPALRVYNNSYLKSYESWFVDGDITLDIIFPANLRRKETEQLPDTVSAALLQQFRSSTFFEDLCGKVPGLNELGKRVDVDKSLAFEWGENLLPLTQILMNFRVDLRKWDEYLESNYREKETPFERTLEDLTEIFTEIRAVGDNLSNEDEDVNVTVDIEQSLEE